MPLDRRTDEALVCARSPVDAGPSFEAFYLRHQRLVVAFHVRRVRDAELAAELTAETFAQALASRQRFRPGGSGSAVRWLFGIAANVLATSARAASKQQRVRDALEISVPLLDDPQLRRIEQAGETSAVLDALEELPPDQRDAVRAYVLGDLSYEEIAEQAGTTNVAARKRVSRGLAALRRTANEEVSR